MKLFEYMGKNLFHQYGIPVPRGKMAATPEEAAAVAQEIGQVVIKSQILSGKRGKAGGIKFADSPGEAATMAAELLQKQLNGYLVETVLVEEKLKIDRELYLSITMDGAQKRPVILASAEGGMDIEEVPPEKIVRYVVEPQIGVKPFVGREISFKLGLKGELSGQMTNFLQKLYQLFTGLDAELTEINPLVVSGQTLVAADSKITIDDEALWRHPDLPVVSERTAAEEAANTLGLSYVQLDGDIAIMANGAGITMATLDVLKFYGGQPANFLDAGGGANVEQTAKALEILLSTKPKVILINIFGGITRCDDVARAFIQVKNTREIPVPVVIRMVGTNEAQGVQLLKENGVEAYKTMQEAAQKAVELSKGA